MLERNAAVDQRYKACLARALKKTPILQATFEQTPWLREANSLKDILAKLKDEDTEVRRTAIWFLARLGDKRAATSLIDSMHNDPDVYERGNAADSLGSLDSKRGVLPLLDILQHDPEVKVRERAASGLRWLSDERVIDVLITVLANRNEDPYVREMVAEGVSCHNAKKAAPVLIECLRDESVNVRYWSAESLASSECADALPELERVARDDTAMCYDPDGKSLAYGSVSGAAANAMISIKEDLGIPLTEEEADYLAGRRSKF